MRNAVWKYIEKPRSVTRTVSVFPKYINQQNFGCRGFYKLDQIGMLALEVLLCENKKLRQ